jgi:hypothetical protein
VPLPARRFAIAGAAALAALAAPAAAQASSASVSPNTAGAASRASVDISFDQSADNPSSVVVRVERGFAFDPRALAVKCDKAHADANNCPAKSRIGGGTADVTATIGVFPPSHLTAKVDLYLAPARRSGDIAGVVAHVKEEQSGSEGSVVGRIHPEVGGQFGLDTIFENLDKSFTPPQGVKVHLDRLQISFGGQHRTVKKKVKSKKHGKKKKKKKTKSVRYDLIKNPATCTGSWAYEIDVDQRPPESGSVACAAG